MGCIIWVLFTIYSSFKQWKNFDNRLDFDKIITISWVVHVFGTQCIDKMQRRYQYNFVKFLVT